MIRAYHAEGLTMSQRHRSQSAMVTVRRAACGDPEEKSKDWRPAPWAEARAPSAVMGVEPQSELENKQDPLGALKVAALSRFHAGGPGGTRSDNAYGI